MSYHKGKRQPAATNFAPSLITDEEFLRANSIAGVQQIIRDRTLQQGATVPVKPPPLTAEPAEDELTVQESVVYEMLGHRIDHRTSLVKEALKSDVQNMIQRLSAPVDPRNQEMEAHNASVWTMLFMAAQDLATIPATADQNIRDEVSPCIAPALRGAMGT